MPPISAFVTQIHRAPLLNGRGGRMFARTVAHAARAIAADDAAGQAWSRDNAYAGYTSYAALDDLAWRFGEFAELTAALAPHARAFARACDFDLRGRTLAIDSLWVNVLAPGGAHSGHIHPGSAISGTYYAETPPGSGALRFEDPRLGLMMAAPPRRASAQARNAPFLYLAPKAGEVILWESWLRHEVMRNNAKTPRISVSFNFSVR